MSIVLIIRIESNVSEDLHSDDGINEEQHGDEQNDIRQSFEWLNKSPKQNTNGVTLAKQLHQTGCTKQP